MTDGIENEPKWIAKVSGLIDSRTYAVGLGDETQVNTQALTALAGSTGGVLLLSGLLSSSLDDQFRLRKFFLQILAGVTDTSIVKDPVGYISPNTRVCIPFELSEADINCRVILLTDFPVVWLSIETPDGYVIDAGNAVTFAVTFDSTNQTQTASYNLPVVFQNDTIHAGTWYAILEVDEDAYKKYMSREEDRKDNQRILSDLRSKGAKYCLSVHSFSNLRMNAVISQDSFKPGSKLFIRASLTEYNLPVEKRAVVAAELVYPDSSQAVLPFSETQPGIFEASLTASLAGIYRYRIVASGGTFRGVPFTREQILNAAVFHEIKDPTGEPPFDSGSSAWCGLLSCLLNEEALSREFEQRLKKQGIDLEYIRKYVQAYCDTRRRPGDLG